MGGMGWEGYVRSMWGAIGPRSVLPQFGCRTVHATCLLAHALICPLYKVICDGGGTRSVGGVAIYCLVACGGYELAEAELSCAI